MDQAGRQLGQRLVNGTDSSRPAPSGTPGASAKPAGRAPSAMGHARAPAPAPAAGRRHGSRRAPARAAAGERHRQQQVSRPAPSQQAGRHGSGRAPARAAPGGRHRQQQAGAIGHAGRQCQASRPGAIGHGPCWGTSTSTSTSTSATPGASARPAGRRHVSGRAPAAPGQQAGAMDHAGRHGSRRAPARAVPGERHQQQQAGAIGHAGRHRPWAMGHGPCWGTGTSTSSRPAPSGSAW